VEVKVKFRPEKESPSLTGGEEDLRTRDVNSAKTALEEGMSAN